jgi:branched-chain amino acid transport system substrate-binding protein
MKKLFLALVAGAFLYIILWPQWRSFHQMGVERFKALSQPSKELLVGVCWPFSTNQDGMKNGLLLAQEEINSRGLANGLRVVLDMQDTYADWEHTKQIAVGFSNASDMSAVIGYYDDSTAIKATNLYEASGLLHIMVGANHTVLTKYGHRFIIRSVLASDKIARALSQMALSFGTQKIALIAEDEAFGNDLAYHLQVSLDEKGGKLVYNRVFSRDRADFRLPANELKEIEPDLVFFAGIEPWAGDFLKEIRQIGIKTPFVGAFSDTPEFRMRAGPGLEGAMFFDFYDVNATHPENLAFVSTFRENSGKIPMPGPPKATTPCTCWPRRSARPKAAIPSTFPTPSGT